MNLDDIDFDFQEFRQWSMKNEIPLRGASVIFPRWRRSSHNSRRFNPVPEVLPGPAYESLEVPFQAHSDTSLAAAQSIKPHVRSLREKVLHIFRTHDWRDYTDEELALELDRPDNTVRPRRIELARAGLIEEWSKRPTSSGRMAVTWIYKEPGKAQ